ncbi:unnamed protein product [Nezara viridula]|uniref:Uncharacterized protein n=1 Tax=Nezara viridula TaxID=85310 RepID=A0A9P0H8E7_NEZVI|nr:unnamed protein product [Nezara viridula]
MRKILLTVRSLTRCHPLHSIDNIHRGAAEGRISRLHLEETELAGFRSSSQGQVNSAVAAKEHSIVHLRGPQEALISTILSALVRTGEDGMPQSTP